LVESWCVVTTYDYQEALKNAAKSMVRVKHPRRLLKMMVRFIDREVGLTHASILIYDGLKSRYILVDSRGALKIPINLIKLDQTNPLIRWFLEKKIPAKIKKDFLCAQTLKQWINDPSVLNGKSDCQKLRTHLHQLSDVMKTLKVSICIPGYYDKDLLGVLLLGSKVSGEKFTQAELAFFQTLVNDASMTLKTAEFQEGLIQKNRELESKKKQLEVHVKEIETLRLREQETYYEIVMSLAQEVYAKDPHTAAHLEGVERLGVMTAEEMGYDLSQRRKDVLVASLHLHDVGKIGVPDHILKKPTTLTEEEWKIMRLHPEKGAKILRPLTGFKDVAKIVLYHHERFDGNGYPEGLKGEEIPIESRIISVVDAFHAIISTRCYKKGHPLQTGYRELERCSGTQFDPKVVDAFIRAHKRWVIKTGTKRSKSSSRAVA
jgi:HD-GYP domain-containing protein (c-di-GMP phosphodiesterase class II)